MQRAVVLGVLVASGAIAMATAACRAPWLGVVTSPHIERVKDNLYMIGGSDPAERDAFSGGNTGVFITDAGVVVVDTKLAGWGQMILDEIKTVTDKPVTTIINTHNHGDHVGGNSAFPGTIEIVAHENALAHMRAMDLFVEDATFLPRRTFTDTLSLGSGKDRIDLHYFGRGHTDGDAWVVFPSLGVMQTGDMFGIKDAPVIDRKNNGSGLEYAATLGKALDTIKGVDTLIVGHSPRRSIEELREYQRFMIEFVAAVKQAHDAGTSIDDAADRIDLRSKYPGYEKRQYRAAIRAIYDELDPPSQ